MINVRDPERIDPVVDELRAVWAAQPDVRLGQLMFNFTHWACAQVGQRDLFYVEDDQLLELLRMYRARCTGGER